MKSIKKFFSFALGLMVGFAATSCSDAVEYNPADAVAGAQVFFAPASTSISSYELAGDQGALDVQLQRVVTSGDLTVAVTLVQQGDVKPLSAPTSVTFKDGQDKASVAIAYVTKDMEYDVPVSASLEIVDEHNLTPYASSVYEFSVVVPAPWTPWISTKAEWVEAGQPAEAWPLSETESTCTYTYNNYFGGVDAGLTIYYRQYLLDPSVAQFMITNWGGLGDPLYIDYNTVTHNCQVLPQHAADNDNYGPVTIADVAHWQNNDALYANYPCTYDPATGVFVLNVAWYVSAGSFGNDPETIQVDGFYVPDYSAAVEFEGVLTDKDQNVFAQFMADYGVDVESAKGLVVEKGADAGAVADALAAGDVEGFDIVRGLNKLPIVDLVGDLKVVVVTIADGEAKAVAEASFEYYGGGKSPWKSLGMGLYTDDIVTPLYYTNAEGVQVAPTPTYAVEILENEETPGLYRVMNPYSNSVFPYAEDDCAPEGLFLEVNATDPQAVYIDLQELGFDWGDGPMAFVSEGARMLAKYDFETLKSNDYFGAVKEGVISFPVFATQSGLEYQGIIFLGDNGYYAGSGDLKIVLPSAVPAEAKAKKVVAKSHKFTRHFHGVKYFMNQNVNKKLANTKLVSFKK